MECVCCDLDQWNDVREQNPMWSPSGRPLLHLGNCRSRPLTHPRGYAKIRYEVCTGEEEREDLLYSICDRKCGKIARSEGDPAAGRAH